MAFTLPTISSIQIPQSAGSKFVTGPDVNPFARVSQEPIRLLGSVTNVELAAAVPFIKIVRIDRFTGKPLDDGNRQLMFDLVETPNFSDPSRSFVERPLVSLLSMTVKTSLATGAEVVFKEIELSFKVHRPDVVFDRFSDAPWRQLMNEGASFTLEYGWVADDKLVKNELFNGHGFFDTVSGLVIPSTNFLLLSIYKYSLNLQKDGQVEMTFSAKENGDLALRQARLSGLPMATTEAALKAETAREQSTIKSLLDSLPRTAIKGKGNFYSALDVFNTLIAGPVENVIKQFGYAGVNFFAANFNNKAGPLSNTFGGMDVSGRSIGDFMFPVDQLNKSVANTISTGKDITLMSFVASIVNVINSAEAWGAPTTEDRQRPSIAVVTRTVTLPGDDKATLIFQIVDRQFGTNPFQSNAQLDIPEQTRNNVLDKVRAAGVPIIEFGRADSLILDASFELQTNPEMQGVQIDLALRDLKDRGSITSQPDRVQLDGKALSNELIPISILQGEITFHGNFILEALAPVWVEFYGAKEISGLFRATEKLDTLGPGSFKSQFSIMSEGLDPLNTRRAKTQQELSSEVQAVADNKRKSKALQKRKT